jgi:predicted aspartyl protease
MRRDEEGRRRQNGAGQQLAVANPYSALAEDDEKASGEETEVANVGVIRLGASSGSGRSSTIVARGQLNGEWCDDMLIDTGASCCFVRRSWVHSTRLQMTPLRQQVTVTLADERTVQVVHEVRVARMDVYGSVATCRLLVMDELSNDVIVGLDWQRETGLAIIPGREHDMLNGQRVAHQQRRPKQQAQLADDGPSDAEPAAELAADPTAAAAATRGPTRVTFRGGAVLMHLRRADTQRATTGEQTLNGAVATQKAATIDAAAADNERLRDVLQRHRSVFTEELPIKTAEQIAASKQFSIVLIGSEVRPVKQRERRMSPAEIEAATQWVKDEVAAGRMEPSTSEWAAQLVIVPKRNDKGEVSGWRICGDYRNLNEVTKADAEPLPLMQMAYDRLAGMQYFSKLDLLKGFNQIPVEARSREYMAVSTPVGLYQPTVMPFGVKNAPGSFQREMRRVLSGKLNHGVFVFIDDIILWSRTEEEHLLLIDWVLGRLKAEGYYAHPGKCQFMKSEVNFLGHVVSRRGVSMQQHKVQAVKSWPVPTTVKDVRAFLGLAGFYRRFVKGFASVAKPLTDLTCVKDRDGWEWGSTEQQAFDTLKQALIEAPILAHPDPQRQWIVQTDASGFAIGAVLSQKQDDGTVRPVAYWSEKLTSAPRNYCATERELMAIVRAVEHWREYLFGSPHPVLLRSDHKPLVYLSRKTVLGQRLTGWMELLSDYTFEIGYVKGKDNGAADALSRRSDHEVQGVAEPAPVQQRTVKLLDEATARTWRGPDWRSKVQQMNEQSPLLAAAKRKAKPTATAGGQKKDYSQFTELWLLVENLQAEARAAGAKDEKYQLLLKGDEQHDGLRRVDGLVLSRTGAVYVPDNRALKTKLVELAHMGHFGRDRTLEHLARHCYWVGMTREVDDFVRGCHTCQANKTPSALPAGLLRPLPIPNQVWDSVGVDFVGPFPTSTGGPIEQDGEAARVQNDHHERPGGSAAA